MNSVFYEAVKVPAYVAYEALKNSVLYTSKQVAGLIENHINLNRVLIISSIALSCIAILASLVYGSFLSLSLSVTVVAASCLAYKLNEELLKKEEERLSLHKYVVAEDRQKKEHLEEHGRMQGAIENLESQLEVQTGLAKEQTTLNGRLQENLTKAYELAELCNKALSKYSTTTLESTGIKEEIESYKKLFEICLPQIKRLIEKQDHNEAAAEKVVSAVALLEGFSKGQHAELTGMLDKLQLVVEQFNTYTPLVEEQKKALQAISADILVKTGELLAIHRRLEQKHELLLPKDLLSQRGIVNA